MTILRCAPQVADVLHRHEVLQPELGGNFAALRDGAQYLRAGLVYGWDSVSVKKID
jgi:hypothetical protein